MYQKDTAPASALLCLCRSNLSCVPKSYLTSTGILHVCDLSVEHEENTAAVTIREILGHTRHPETLVLADGF